MRQFIFYVSYVMEKHTQPKCDIFLCVCKLMCGHIDSQKVINIDENDDKLNIYGRFICD